MTMPRLELDEYRRIQRSPLQTAAELRRLQESPPVLVGRDHELREIRARLLAGRPVFVSGRAGVGKSAVLRVLYGTWTTGNAGMPLYYCAESRTRRSVATCMLVNLLLHRKRLHSEYIGRRKAVASLGALSRFIARERLPDLQRMMHQNLQPGAACVVLDHADHPHAKVASLTELWLETTPLVIVARDAAATGRARRLLSCCDRVEIEPLPKRTLIEMARDVARRRNLPLHDADVQEAAALAEGRPGRLCDLLDAAVKPDYRRHGRVRWSLIHIDLLVRSGARGRAFAGSGAPAGEDGQC
jgi:hypothetical protein